MFQFFRGLFEILTQAGCLIGIFIIFSSLDLFYVQGGSFARAVSILFNFD